MSRKKCRNFPPQKPVRKENCVCHVVKKIVNAQNKIREDDYATSCSRSIRQLKGAARPRNNTIPFMLYCRNTCKPFVGSGVFQAPKKSADNSCFGCVESVVFRAKSFVNCNDCCVKLELLLPVTEKCGIVTNTMDHSHSASSFFPADDTATDFLATGICLIVDLNEFIGITCLDPITPLSVKEYPFIAHY